MSKITGRVIDYTNDTPVLGVLVQGVAKDGSFFASTTTDVNGNFSLDNPLLEDVYSKVSFSKDGYANASMRPASANNTDVVLAKANTLASVTLTLKRDPKKALLFIVIGGVVAYLLFKYKNKLKF